jgi:hypothetical protein
MTGEAQETDHSPPPRKPYKTPELVTYGDVRVLTSRTSHPSGPDGGPGNQRTL